MITKGGRGPAAECDGAAMAIAMGPNLPSSVWGPTLDGQIFQLCLINDEDKKSEWLIFNLHPRDCVLNL